MRTLNVILDEGLYLNGTQYLVLLILAVTVLVLEIVDTVKRIRKKMQKAAYEASLVHRGWENRREWESQQLRASKRATGEYTLNIKNDWVNDAPAIVMDFWEEDNQKGGD